jgi:hypothetical protein
LTRIDIMSMSLYDIPMFFSLMRTVLWMTFEGKTNRATKTLGRQTVARYCISSMQRKRATVVEASSLVAGAVE